MNTLIKSSLKGIKPTYIIRRSFGTDPFKTKEAAEEKQFINRTERETLKKLLRQVKEQLDKDHIENETKDLKNILNKYKINVTSELIKDIKDWRDLHH